MDTGAVVAKTEKGQEEIKTRGHQLPKELRRVLILVDGQSTVDELAEKGAGWDVAGGLAELAREGFVAIGGITGEPLDADVGGVRDQLVRIAEEVLADEAGKVVEKLRASPETREGLLETVAQCKKLVRLLIDEAKAEELEGRCRGALSAL